MNLSRKPSGVRSYSAPGKTFLLGEYLALEGGSAILAATGPRFALRVDEGAPDFSPFHVDSPAGRWLKSSEKKLKGLVEFDDPHQGLGGLGASSAQFALVYAATHDLSSIEYGSEHWLKLQSEFSSVPGPISLRKPSGGDLISQLSGGLIEYSKSTNSVEHLNWAFADLTFTLIRTGVKVKTHEHLASRFEIPYREMESLVAHAKKSIQVRDENGFLSSVNSFAKVLLDAQLTVDSTLGLLEKMRNQGDLFKAVKGCGALGADIIFAVHSKQNESSVQAWLKKEGLQVCGSLASLSPGLRQDSALPVDESSGRLKETAQ